MQPEMHAWKDNIPELNGRRNLRIDEAGTYLGFVEGWQFSANYNTVSVTALLSPLAFSLQAMQWDEVPIAELWNTISGSLEWQDAILVA